MLKNKFAWALAAGFCVGGAQASEYHYKDLLIGERAAGLGGAFAAISDDPSGIYHNPAGIAFSMENYLSISANAFASTSQQYADIYPGQSYTYRSQTLIPALFGFTQSIGRKGKLGFAVVVPDSATIDQSDTVADSADPTNATRQFTRKFLREDTTYLIGPCYAREILPNLSFGVSLFGAVRFIKTIDNTTVLRAPIGTGKYVVYNMQADQTEYGLEPKVGFQYMPIPKLALGLTISKMLPMGGNGDLRTLETNTDNSGNPVTPNGFFNNDYATTHATNVFHDMPQPLQISLGGAYFFNKEFLVSTQLDYYGSQDTFTEYPIRAVVNWSVGSEYYLSESWALRLAVYSNNTNAHEVDPTQTDQPAFVNQLATALGISMYRPGSSITLGLTYAKGSGYGQAFSGVTNVQQVTENNLTLYLGGSYQL